tara:strand:+ start:232 stop:669 length:438 start_codon:yes stop_codon:yes gene_type:complete
MSRLGTSYGLYKAGEGIQDLLGDRFAGSKGLGDIASGAGRGAAIGNMFMPGVGTAIGAGIGAGYSGIKNIFQEFGNPFGGGPNYGSMDQNNLTRMLGRGNASEGQAAYDELVKRGINPDDAYRRLSLASRNFQYTDPGMAGQETA